MPAFLRFFALMFAVLSAASVQAQSTSGGSSGNDSNQIPTSVMDILRTDSIIDSGFDKPTGSHLRFAKAEETTFRGKPFVTYRVYVEGARLDGSYILAYLKNGSALSDIQILSDKVYVNHRGLLLASKPSGALAEAETAAEADEIRVAMGPMAKGEPARLVLRSKDNKILISGTLLKHPIESLDNGCKLSALIAAPEANAVLVYAEGFPPNLNLTMHSTSAGEVREISFKTSDRGRAATIELPYVTGKDSGAVTETIKTDKCTVSVEIPWGKGSYQPF